MEKRMSGVNPVVEPILRVPRFFRTVSAARKFDAQSGSITPLTGDEGYRMRSAMDMHPRAGRLMSRLGVRNPQGEIPSAELVATSTFVSADDVSGCVAGLNRDGVYVFKNRLPAAMVEEMRASALSVPSMPRGLDTEPAPYPRANPVVGRYDIDENLTMASPGMQDFCSDPALASIAAAYLGQPVIQDQTALWWTTTQGSADAALNAWLFHQDRDRLSFVKFFVYLTDVEKENGPHVYIKGTHRKVPRSLATDGRKTDDLVRNAGLWDQVVELTGPAGTMLAVDTVGLHKGMPPQSGDRLVLQVEYATSLFGATPDFPVFEPTDLASSRYASMPRLLQRWKNSFTQ
jgi:hypothetical protein